jgi:hypothetical protein
MRPVLYYWLPKSRNMVAIPISRSRDRDMFLFWSNLVALKDKCMWYVQESVGSGKQRGKEWSARRRLGAQGRCKVGVWYRYARASQRENMGWWMQKQEGNSDLAKMQVMCW